MFCIVVVRKVLFVIWVLSVIVTLDSNSLYRATKWHIVPPLARSIILNPAIYFEYSFKLPYLRSCRHWEPKRTGSHGTPRAQDRVFCFHCQLMMVLCEIVAQFSGLSRSERHRLVRVLSVQFTSNCLSSLSLYPLALHTGHDSKRRAE